MNTEKIEELANWAESECSRCANAADARRDCDTEYWELRAKQDCYKEFFDLLKGLVEPRKGVKVDGFCEEHGCRISTADGRCPMCFDFARGR